MDLLAVWPAGAGREVRFVVECKLVREGRSRVLDHRNGAGTDGGLYGPERRGRRPSVVFDMREGRTRAEKIYTEERRRNGTPITVWGA
ncbi:hypothetical protein [Candidatus Palauibacter sp.]|uniref:hypothetical protein n=1 Tax=Candidatus Palauibacter sp. TaxID=3101350 RepID=UPI003AF255B5